MIADLDEGGIALIDGFTGGALEFEGGEAEIALDANGRIDLSQDFPLQDLDVVGEIILNNTILETTVFAEPLNVTAEIVIDESLLQVEQLVGTFADSEISAAGILPLFESREGIGEPLTLVFRESEIDLDQLYEGGIEGEVMITGNAVSPTIGGAIELFDGQGFVPEGEEQAETEIALDETNEDIDTETAFTPRLQDFAIVLEDFRFQQEPLYQFAVSGDLILNGAADNVTEIQADGTLEVERADVDFVSSEFNLQQAYNNVIIFDPQESILNPFIDIRLETEVSELADIDRGVIDDNEIPDPISQVGRNETINITLNVQGEAERIVPRIDEDPDNLCLIEPPLEPLFAEEIYTQEELTQLAECINANAFAEGSVREILNSPAVSLDSNPPRSQGAILSLLGKQFIGLAEELQESNEQQLFEFGVTQFVITPLEREIFNFADQTIIDIGEEINLDYLRVYPAIEGTYRLSDESSVSATYDYFFNEFKVRYQMQF